MTLKEAYKQWSQQKENHNWFIKTKEIFGKVWSSAPFNLECSNYSDTDLATYLLNSKSIYGDKVKATSVIISVLNFGLGKACGFTMSDVLSIYNNYKPQEEEKKDNKPKPDIFKPLKYNDKPLIPQEVSEEPKIIEKKKSKQGKPVYQLDDFGSLIKKWDNVKEAAKDLGVKETSIYKAISVGFKVKDSFWSRNPELIDGVKENKPIKSKPKEVTSNTADLISKLKDIVNKLRKRDMDIKVIINI